MGKWDSRCLVSPSKEVEKTGSVEESFGNGRMEGLADGLAMSPPLVDSKPNATALGENLAEALFGSAAGPVAKSLWAGHRADETGLAQETLATALAAKKR